MPRVPAMPDLACRTLTLVTTLATPAGTATDDPTAPAPSASQADAPGAIRPVSPGALARAARATGPLAVARAYLALTKPRIVELLLVTAVPAMILAASGRAGGAGGDHGGLPSLWLMA